MSDKSIFNDATEAPAETIEETIDRLAALPLLEYEQCRKDEAKRLGFRASMMDKLTGKGKQEQASASGEALILEDCKQWHETVGSESLNDVLNSIMRHMHMQHHDAVICTLWIAHTHAYKIFNHTPRIIIDAPAPECGKSVLLHHLIGNMVNKPLYSESLTPATFFRVAAQCEPTFLIDEGDTFINQDSDLIGGLNQGWEADGGALRCSGDDNEVRKYITHAPVAMAGIKLQSKLPPATISRSFVIELERDSGEIQQPWNKGKHKQALEIVRKKLARWANDNKDKIKNSEPIMPDDLINRTLEKWTPFFKIAETAGNNWHDKILEAYKKLSKKHEPTKDERFLIDVKQVLSTNQNIHTHTLIDRLCHLEDSPYIDYNYKAYEPEKRKIQSTQIANKLKSYGIKSASIKIKAMSPLNVENPQVLNLIAFQG